MGQRSLSLKSLPGALLGSQKIRFAAVGVINTAVDFGIFLTLSSLFGVIAVVANTISTSCALIISYILNKKAVFGSTDTRNKRQILLFIVVTLSGLWILQNAVIAVVSMLAEKALHIQESAFLLIGAKLVASVASLTWNYLWYSRVVFKDGRA